VARAAARADDDDGAGREVARCQSAEQHHATVAGRRGRSVLRRCREAPGADGTKRRSATTWRGSGRNTACGDPRRSRSPIDPSSRASRQEVRGYADATEDHDHTEQPSLPSPNAIRATPPGFVR
jgi:hypothetical protein